MSTLRLYIYSLYMVWTALSPFCAGADFRDLPPGYVPIMVPFQACQGVNVIAPATSNSPHFIPLTPAQITAFRHQVKDIPVEVVAPVGLLMSAELTNPSDRAAHAELARLVIQEHLTEIARNQRLTNGIRTLCLDPLADKSKWPDRFPETCHPDLKKVNMPALFTEHLQQIPQLLAQFRIYYALASSSPLSTDARLADFQTQVNTQLLSVSLLSLPVRRAPLDDFEIDTAKKIFYDQWLEIIGDLKKEQTRLILHLNGTPSWIFQKVADRLKNLDEALQLKADPEAALQHAFSLVDPDLQRMAGQRWARAKYKFLQVAISTLNDARVVGLMQRNEARADIADLDQAYATMNDYQTTETARFTQLREHPTQITDVDIFEHINPLNQVLYAHPNLCAIATTLFYQNTNSTLRTQALSGAAFLGLTAILPTPPVFVGAMMYALYGIVQADRSFNQAWLVHMSSDFDIGAISRTEDLVQALDQRQAAGRNVMMNAVGLGVLKKFFMGGASEGAISDFNKIAPH